jgi:hypothetical protein
MITKQEVGMLSEAYVKSYLKSKINRCGSFVNRAL